MTKTVFEWIIISRLCDNFVFSKMICFGRNQSTTETRPEDRIWGKLKMFSSCKPTEIWSRSERSLIRSNKKHHIRTNVIHQRDDSTNQSMLFCACTFPTTTLFLKRLVKNRSTSAIFSIFEHDTDNYIEIGAFCRWCIADLVMASSV